MVARLAGILITAASAKRDRCDPGLAMVIVLEDTVARRADTVLDIECPVGVIHLTKYQVALPLPDVFFPFPADRLMAKKFSVALRQCHAWKAVGACH